VTVAVFGGSSGIGRACTERLAAAGTEPVAVFDLRPGDDPPTGAALVRAVDVRDEDAVASALGEAVDELGPLSGMVFAAGTARVTPLLEIDRKEWDLVLSVNLTGAWVALAAAARLMADAGGAVVLITSVDSARPVAGLAHYCATKAGVESLARVAALELGRSGIRVHAVAPGVVATPLMQPLLDVPEVRDDFLEHIPLGRLGAPDDIADTVAYLLSPAASYITGQAIAVDGGMSLREHARLLRGD